MKLRALALLLVLANLAFLAWTQGWLGAVVGLHAHGDREPERLARQFQPHGLRILPPSEAAAAMSGAALASAPPGGGACLEAGPYSLADADAAERIMQLALPAESWVRRDVGLPGVWLVYIGPFTAAEPMQKKADVLRRLQAPFDEVRSPPELAPGLSLGRFEQRAEADKALEQLVQRGVRTARVVALSEPAPAVSLRVEHADAALRAQLAALGGEVKGQALGKAFVACAR